MHFLFQILSVKPNVVPKSYAEISICIQVLCVKLPFFSHNYPPVWLEDSPIYSTTYNIMVYHIM
jgi:hypothetical protein